MTALSTSFCSLAYRAGVTSAVTAPNAYGVLAGLSTAFSLGAAHKLAHGAIMQNVAAVHVSIAHGDSVSVSTEIATLRTLLLEGYKGEAGKWFEKVSEVRGFPGYAGKSN
jgi:hypothetical protein